MSPSTSICIIKADHSIQIYFAIQFFIQGKSWITVTQSASHTRHYLLTTFKKNASGIHERLYWLRYRWMRGKGHSAWSTVPKGMWMGSPCQGWAVIGKVWVTACDPYSRLLSLIRALLFAVEIALPLFGMRPFVYSDCRKHSPCQVPVCRTTQGIVYRLI